MQVGKPILETAIILIIVFIAFGWQLINLLFYSVEYLYKSPLNEIAEGIGYLTMFYGVTWLSYKTYRLIKKKVPNRI